MRLSCLFAGISLFSILRLKRMGAVSRAPAGAIIVSILEEIQSAADFLAARGVPSPRLEAELLLAAVLGMPRLQLYLNFGRQLQPGELDALKPLVERRARREPLQHITGTTSFCGIELAVNSNVLVPRPETELLAECGWVFLNQRSQQNTEPHPSPLPEAPTRKQPPLPSPLLHGGGEGDEMTRERSAVQCVSSLGNAFPSDGRGDWSALAVPPSSVPGRNPNPNPNPNLNPAPNPTSPTALDLCTGGGCLAIALAIHAPRSQIHATDLSSGALAVARQNAARHQAQLEGRIQFHEGDLFAGLSASLRFDLIVSNPPYIPTARIESLEPEVRDYEPRPALDGGRDGLDFYRRIAAEAGAFLEPSGRIMVELDAETSGAAKELFERQNWVVEAMQKDYHQHARILIAHLPFQ